MSGQTQMTMSAKETHNSGSKRDLCLLSLDGGGVRGLSSLLILQKLMESIDPENPPKPCEYFDMIGGTSTGGLIAIMLGRLRLTVEQCIEEYTKLSPLIFTQSHTLPLNSKLKIQGRFNTKGFEEAIQSLVHRVLGDKDALLKEDIKGIPCTESKVFVVATGHAHAKPVVFSNYFNNRRGNNMRSVVKIWEAARATSAAPSFFDPITIKNQKFGDGGTGANNPVNILWGEARDLFKPKEADWDLSNNLQCLVSIGTGKLLLTEITDAPESLLQALKSIATDTEMKANEFQREHDGLFRGGDKRAFRFNVVSGLEKIGLAEVKMMPNIEAVTEEYIQSQQTFDDFNLCSDHMKQREWVERLKKLAKSSTKEFDASYSNTKHSQELFETCRHTSVYQTWLQAGSRLEIDQKATDGSIESPAAAIAHGMRIHEKQVGGSKLFFCYLNGSASISAHSALRSLVLQVLGWQDGSSQTNEALLERLEMMHHGQTLRKVSLSDGNSAPAELAKLLRDIASIKNGCLVIVIDRLDAMPATVLDQLKAINNVRGPKRLLISTHSPKGAETTVHEGTEYLECYRALRRNAQANSRRDQIDNPVPGTIDWLWKHDSYTRWNSRESGVLFIRGKPGSGKSVLAKAISDGYANVPNQDSDASRALMSSWFYSTRGGSAARLHEKFLQAVILQWLDQDSGLWSLIRPVWRETFAAGTFTSFETLSRVMREVVSTGRKIMTIVDAIDESIPDSESEMTEQSNDAVQRRDVLERFQELASGIPDSRAKFIVLSRPMRELLQTLTKERADDYFMITMEEENKDALAMIIEHSLTKLKRRIWGEKEKSGAQPNDARALTQHEKEAVDRVRAYLTENADGVILWPKLVINNLTEVLEGDDDIIRDLTKRLKLCPKDLTELYKGMVEQLSSSGHIELTDARRLLMWISGSPVVFQRPITIGALYETSWIPTYEENQNRGEDPFSQDAASDGNLEQFTRRLRRLCGAFIDVKQNTQFGVHRTDTVELGHRTMKDFLAGQDAGKLRFIEEDALDTIRGQSEIYFNMINRCLQKLKDRATDPEDGKDPKHPILNFFDLVERRMFLDLGCTACDNGLNHKDRVHCPRQMLGNSIDKLREPFEFIIRSSAPATLTAVRKSLMYEDEKMKAKDRDQRLNELLPVSAFLAREESPTAVTWEKQISSYLPEKQRELLDSYRALIIAELIYWACSRSRPATTANLLRPFLWSRFGGKVPASHVPYRNRFLDLIRTAVLAGVDAGLDRIFSEHLFEYPVLLYTITERLRQLKEKEVHHDEFLKSLRRCGRSSLKNHAEKKRQQREDQTVSPGLSDALVRGREANEGSLEGIMQRDLRQIRTTLGEMASDLRSNHHEGATNCSYEDELKLSDTCEALSLVLGEAERLLVRPTQRPDISLEEFARLDVSLLRSRHDWKKFIRERSFAGKFGVHHHILGAVDRVALRESDFMRFWPKEKPVQLSEALEREEDTGETPRETPARGRIGSLGDAMKNFPSIKKRWGR